LGQSAQVETAWDSARALWRTAPAEEQRLGCSLIVIGAQKARGFVHRNIGFRLDAPHFNPEPFGKEPVSIGSGSDVDAYRDLLRESGSHWLDRIRRFDLARVGPLEPFGAILGDTIAANPTPGVSPHLHLCQVRCNDMRWHTNDRTLSNGKRWSMPNVAKDMPSYLKLCGAHNVVGGAATA